MKKYLIITADENDGDYLTEKVEVTDDVIEKIKPIVKVLKDRHNEFEKSGDWDLRHNWEIGEIEGDKTPEKLYVETGFLTEEQVEFFNELIPYGSYGIHTIENIEILVVAEEITLF